MKKVNITNSEKKINSNNLVTLEHHYQFILPENLKKLYLKYNGGEIEFQDSSIYDFASIKYGELTLENLIDDLILVEPILPEGFLPFAITGVGNIVTIYMDTQVVNNKIYLFRSDELTPIFLANSLEEWFGVTSIDEL